MSDKDDAIADAQTRFERAQEIEADNRREALDDWRFSRLAEQWPERVRRDRELEGRPCLTINRLPSFIRQVVNDARQNKPSIVVHPVNDEADPEVADVLNGLIRNIEQSSDAEVAYDTALECAATGGIGYFKVNTRYACDDIDPKNADINAFAQDIVIERVVNPFSIYGDPDSTAADSSDWSWATELEIITKSAFERRWKDAEFTSFTDDGYELAEHLRNTDSVVIASEWMREQIETQIVMLSDGSVIDIPTYEKQKDLYDALEIEVVGQPRATKSYKVTQRLMNGSEVLEEVDWAGKFIPIIPVYGEEFNIEGKRYLRSLVRDAKDPQRMFNYWRTTSTELVALAPKAPFIGRKGAFQSDEAKWSTINTQTWSHVEYDGQEMPQRQPFAGVPAGALQEAMNAQDDIKSILGIYDAAIGAQGNETSGRAIMARQRESDTSNFHYTDNLARAIRHGGRVVIDLIPKVYSVPRIVRTIGKDGSTQNVPVNQPHQQPVMGPDGQPQTVQQQDPATGQMMETLHAVEKVFDLTVGKYDVTVESGPGFATKREELNTVLVELIRAYPPAAPVLMDIIMDTFDLPDSDQVVERLKAMVPPQAQGQQQGPDPKAQQAMQNMMNQLQQLQGQNQKLTLQLQQAKDSSAIDAQRLQIDSYQAETDRMSAAIKLSQPKFPASPHTDPGQQAAS